MDVVFVVVWLEDGRQRIREGLATATPRRPAPGPNSSRKFCVINTLAVRGVQISFLHGAASYHMHIHTIYCCLITYMRLISCAYKHAL